MADKEATVFVVDVSQAMAKRREDHGDSTGLDWAKEFLMYKLAPKIFAGRKTDYIAVICVGSQQTKHQLQGDPEYEHINVVIGFPKRDPGKPNPSDYAIGRPQISVIQESLVPSSHVKGDLLSAIVVGVDLLGNFCSKYKFIKNLIVITGGELDTDFDGVADIAEQINTLEINLTVMGIDFDDHDFGVIEENKSATKQINEKGLKELCNACQGVYATFAEVYESIKVPKVKQVRPVATFKGELHLGDKDKYTESISFNIERYSKTKKATAPSARKISTMAGQRDVKLQSQADVAVPISQGQVHIQRMYKTTDGQEVDREKLSCGYKYGVSIIALPKPEEDFLHYKTEQGLFVVGFVPKNDAIETKDGETQIRRGYKRYLHMSEVSQIMAPTGDRRAQLALSSMIHAMQEFDSYAVGRFVRKDMAPPQMVLLSPHIEPGIEAMHCVDLPFAEDVRQYKFAPLDRIMNVKGEYLKAHRYLPTEDLVNVMDDLVDTMSLDRLAEPAEPGEPASDFLRPEENYSYAVHRTMDAITHRFFNDTLTEIPPPKDFLMRSAQIPSGIKDAEVFQHSVQRAIKVANVKKVPPSTAYKRPRGPASEKQSDKAFESGTGLQDLLNQAGSGGGGDEEEENGKYDEAQRAMDIWIMLLSDGIRARDPIGSFKSLIQHCPIDADIEAPFNLLMPMIDDIIAHSMGDDNYNEAIALMQVMREEAVKNEVDEVYNQFCVTLHEKLTDQGRSDFLARMDKEGLGKVSAEEVEDAEVAKEKEKEELAKAAQSNKNAENPKGNQKGAGAPADNDDHMTDGDD